MKLRNVNTQKKEAVLFISFDGEYVGCQGTWGLMTLDLFLG